jgi:hypothetical protein
VVGNVVSVLVIEVNVAVTDAIGPAAPSPGPATATPTGSTNDVIAPAAMANETARRGRLAEAAALLRQALALWRGQALGGAPSPLLSSKAVRLDEDPAQCAGDLHRSGAAARAAPAARR